jgi:DNA-binding beta-propeller fold protein YncE
VSPDGANLYVANRNSDDISAYAVAADGSLAPVAGSPFADPSSGPACACPIAVAVTPDGTRLYVANVDSTEDGHADVAAYTIAADGSLTSVAGSPFMAGTGPSGIAVAPDGAHLYVTNEASRDVSAFTIAADGSLTVVAGSPFAAGDSPWAIAVTTTKPAVHRTLTVSKSGAGLGTVTSSPAGRLRADLLAHLQRRHTRNARGQGEEGLDLRRLVRSWLQGDEGVQADDELRPVGDRHLQALQPLQLR